LTLPGRGGAPDPTRCFRRAPIAPLRAAGRARARLGSFFFLVLSLHGAVWHTGPLSHEARKIRHIFVAKPLGDQAIFDRCDEARDRDRDLERARGLKRDT